MQRRCLSDDQDTAGGLGALVAYGAPVDLRVSTSKIWLLASSFQQSDQRSFGLVGSRSSMIHEVFDGIKVFVDHLSADEALENLRANVR